MEENKEKTEPKYYTKAVGKAVNEYRKKHKIKRVSLDVKPEFYDQIMAAKRPDETVSAFVRRAIEELIERENIQKEKNEPPCE